MPNQATKDFVRFCKQQGRKPNKYRAKRVTIDGHTFDSQREARRYQELKLMERAGQIVELSLQPVFFLKAQYPSGRVAQYKADFSYEQEWIDTSTGESRMELIVEDVKGKDTPLSKLKRALVQYFYGIEVRLV